MWNGVVLRTYLRSTVFGFVANLKMAQCTLQSVRLHTVTLVILQVREILAYSVGTVPYRVHYSYLYLG